MSSKPKQETDPDQPEVYHLRIKGHLGPQWTEWFEGMVITLEDNGETLLTGPVVDQAALHGLLRRVRDLALPLLSVMRAESSQEDAPDVDQRHETEVRTRHHDGRDRTEDTFNSHHRKDTT